MLFRSRLGIILYLKINLIIITFYNNTINLIKIIAELSIVIVIRLLNFIRIMLGWEVDFM